MRRSPCRSRVGEMSGRSERCSTQLDRASIEVDSLSLHTPDLDDVFLTLTGQPDDEREAV